MKVTSEKSGSTSMKSVTICILFIAAMFSVITSRAQGIVGKWEEQTDAEFRAGDDGKVQESPAHPPFNGKFQVLDIRSDKTFTSTQFMNWIPGVVAVAGVWSIAGDQLKTKTNNVNIDYAINTYTVKQDQNSLELTLTQKPGSFVSKMKKKYKRM